MFNIHSSSRQASDVASEIFRQQSINQLNILENIYNRSSEELWVESWLQQNNIYAALPKLKKINVPLNAMSIRDAKLHLKECTVLLEMLEKLHKELETDVESMTTIEWKQKTIEIGRLKDEFTKLMCKFDNPDIMRYLQQCIKKCNKKRSNQKKQKELKCLQKAREIERRNKLHKDIDQWLLNMKDQTEKVKMEEQMQKEADSVLSEVTKKKSDARKQLSLIIALVKLRTVRESVANHRGEKTSSEDRKAFSITTEKLVNMWESSLKTYTTEEQGLKLMLENNATEDSKAARLAKDRSLAEDWKMVLFGTSHSVPSDDPTFWALTAADRDLETFIAIRKSWDTFVVPPGEELGSKMPVGWVLPEAHCSDEWKKYLENN